MDLSSVIVSQIKKLDHEESAKREAARRIAEAEAIVGAEERAKEEAIRLEEDKRNFAVKKEAFEKSFVREIMANIIVGLNSPKNKAFFPLRKQIIGRYQRAPIWYRPKFFLDKPYSFRGFPNYFIELRYGYQDIIHFFAEKNGQIKATLIISSDICHTKYKDYTLSSNKEEAATQIINFLMKD